MNIPEEFVRFSVRSMARELGCSRDALTRNLQDLAERGIIEIRMDSIGKMVRLTPEKWDDAPPAPDKLPKPKPWKATA